jgi:hypothetical protein
MSAANDFTACNVEHLCAAPPWRQAQGELLRAATRGVTDCFTRRDIAVVQSPEANDIRQAAPILHKSRRMPRTA